MILGLGIDIVEHSRFGKIYQKYGINFLKRYFSEEEIQYCMAKKDPIPHLAARFAIKEAIIKTLGLKHRIGLFYKNIEILGKNFGKKELNLTGKISVLAKERGAKKFHMSISHSKNFSIGIVILED